MRSDRFIDRKIISSQVCIAQTEEERNRIWQFRYGIYVEEQGKPMPGADHKMRIVRDDLDDRATQLYVHSAGDIVGTLRILWGRDGLPQHYEEWYGLDRFDCFAPSELSFTGRMMVAGSRRGSLLTAALACEAYRLGQQNGILFDFIHTTPPLIPLFQRLGHRCYKEEFLDPYLGPRTPMVLVLEDLQHLESTSSPFAASALTKNNRIETARWFQKKFANTVV